MDPVFPDYSQDIEELALRLLALDRLLGSVPLHLQQDLDLDTIFSEDIISKVLILGDNETSNTLPSWDVDALYRVVDTVPRFSRIPTTLVDICRTSWRGRTYQNAYPDSDADESRSPTCSEVLQLLLRLDQLLETSLNNKINAIVSLVPPFRFLDLPTELRLHAYGYILPLQPYLTLLNIEPRRHALPRYDLAALRTCQQVHRELVDHFYKDQVLVMNAYDPSDDSWAFKKNSPRDRLIAQNMRKETRTYFKRLELRILDTVEPNTDRKGLYWEANKTDIWDLDPYFTETLEAFPNLESATVSFEIGERELEYWNGWYRALGRAGRWLIESIPEHIQIRWDFHPTSDPDLQELAEEEEAIMYELKGVVAEETAQRGGTVHLGTRLIKERMVTPARLIDCYRCGRTDQSLPCLSCMPRRLRFGERGRM